MKKVRVFVVPNYGNDVFLKKFINKCNGIKSGGELKMGPLRGCDAPYVMDIYYESIEDLKKFNDGFCKIKTDDFWIENYSDICKN